MYDLTGQSSAQPQSVAGACLCISFHASFCWPPSNCQTRCQRESILTGSMALWKETFANFCAEGLPMLIFHPHATLPHCHIFHPSHSPKQPGCFFGVDQRSLRLQNHSPSQGSHEENPKMIGLLQINITRCHSLPPDQLCLVIETSRIAFFV